LLATHLDRPSRSLTAACFPRYVCLRDGDVIVIDPAARTLNLELPASDIALRMADWQAPDLRARVRPGSVRDKYIRLVSSAHQGCVL
jgi:dihydroxy-acid dehydratase